MTFVITDKYVNKWEAVEYCIEEGLGWPVSLVLSHFGDRECYSMSTELKTLNKGVSGSNKLTEADIKTSLHYLIEAEYISAKK